MSETFTYKARTREGKELSGVIQAENEARAVHLLSEQDLIPIRIKVRRSLAGPGFFGFLKSRLYENLIIFTRNLFTLYQAGIPLLRALGIIKIGPPDGYFNKAISKVKESVQSGVSLARAMAQFPKVFPKIYISAVEAGELSGKLDLILDSLAVMLEKDMELNRQIKSSVRYPVIVLVAISAAFAILVTFVIPRFVAFYAKMGTLLPAPTRALIWLNDFISNYWIFIIAFGVVFFLTLRKIYGTSSGRMYFDTKFLTLPIFGDLIIKGNIARFAQILKILVASGIPVVKSLEILSGVIKNARLASEIDILAESFREGREMDFSQQELVYFPEMALQMVRIGLESGSLDRMLGEAANHYSKEVEYRSRQLTALLEPILTVCLGIFVLIVALAIFLPMWNLIQTFRG